MRMGPRLTPPPPPPQTLVNIKPDLDDSQEGPRTKQKSLKSANWRKFDMSEFGAFWRIFCYIMTSHSKVFRVCYLVRARAMAQPLKWLA